MLWLDSLYSVDVPRYICSNTNGISSAAGNTARIDYFCCYRTLSRISSHLGSDMSPTTPDETCARTALMAS